MLLTLSSRVDPHLTPKRPHFCFSQQSFSQTAWTGLSLYGRLDVYCGEVVSIFMLYSPISALFNERHIDNRKFLLICILLLSHSLIFFMFHFYQYMVVFLFNTAIYVFFLEEAMYSYCCLYIPCILIVVYVFILLSMYSWTRLPWLRVFRAFSSVVRQMPG